MTIYPSSRYVNTFCFFTHSKDRIKAPKFKNWSHDPDHAHFEGVCYQRLKYDMTYQYKNMKTLVSLVSKIRKKTQNIKLGVIWC